MLIHTNKRYIIAFAATTVLLIAAVICFVWLLGHHGFLEVREERCYFSSELHLYCPGCGGSRAVLRLLEGDVIASVLSNPFPVYIILLLLRMWGALLYNTFLSRNGKEVTVLYEWEAWGILVVVLGFFIVRNLLLIFFGIDYLGDMTGAGYFLT